MVTTNKYDNNKLPNMKTPIFVVIFISVVVALHAVVVVSSHDTDIVVANSNSNHHHHQQQQQQQQHDDHKETSSGKMGRGFFRGSLVLEEDADEVDYEVVKVRYVMYE
jgi:hypothetical protein